MSSDPVEPTQPTGQPDEHPQHVLSKSQLKKQLRRQKWLDSRGERRKIERDKRKAKRKLEAQQRAQLDPDQVQHVPKQRYTLMSESANKFRVVIDMDFEDFMTDAEIGKAVQQVGRIYAANRHSENPCQLHVCSLKGKILDRFAITNAGYKSWDINISELDYVDALNQSETGGAGTTVDKNNYVYLSGDASDSLPDVTSILSDESKIFVVGGLVDHNRHKNLCHQRAVARGIPTAKLPIREHITLSQRSILSTVTVFEVLLQVLGSHKSWPEALVAAIPKRKIASDPMDEDSPGSLKDEPIVKENESIQDNDVAKLDCDIDKKG